MISLCQSPGFSLNKKGFCLFDFGLGDGYINQKSKREKKVTFNKLNYEKTYSMKHLRKDKQVGKR